MIRRNKNISFDLRHLLFLIMKKEKHLIKLVANILKKNKHRGWILFRKYKNKNKIYFKQKSSFLKILKKISFSHWR